MEESINRLSQLLKPQELKLDLRVPTRQLKMEELKEHRDI